jgi:hypothetical protein
VSSTGGKSLFAVNLGPMQANRDYFDCGDSKCPSFAYTAYPYPHPLAASGMP